MIAKWLINPKYRLDREAGACFHRQFSRNLFIRLPRLFSDEAFALLTAEVRRLDAAKVRRDLLMAGSGNSPRRMSTLGGLQVAEYSSIIPMIYADTDFLEFVSGIAGEQVFVVPDPIENHVCNFLHELGDIHGGHTDIYPYAFNILLEAPPPGAGGVLELTASQRLEDLDSGAVRRLVLQAPDCYVLRADLAAHRVSALTQPAKRSVINLAYANAKTLNTPSYSSGVLYGVA